MAKRAIYDYALIQRLLNTKIHGKRANLTSGESGDTSVERDLINSGVRIAMSEIDFRGNQVETLLTPNLMEEQWDYALPNDVKADAIVDFRPQLTDSRGEFETYNNVTDEEFDRRKKVEKGIYTITNDGLTRTLRVSADIEDHSLEISSMEDTNWRTFDSVSVNDSDVKVDGSNYVEGNGAIRFQTDTTDSTDSVVGIQNSRLGTADISEYLAGGSAFVDARLTVADTGIHQLTLRLGSDSDNYYQISDSNQNDCEPFQTGWNKVRFDFNNKTTVGTPVDSAIDYASIYWSRDTTTVALLHLNDTDWGFDNLVLKKGKYYYLSYYSRYVWQDTALTLVENSSHDSYALLVQNDELEVIMTKVAELASAYLRDYEDAKYYAGEYKKMKEEYLFNNPSQASVLTTTRYNLNSLEGKPSDTSSDS
jgi:hypothetical protein